MATVQLAHGLTLSYADRGDPAGSVLLMLPGPTDSWQSYEPVLERLSPSIRAIAVSPRGHGDSDKPVHGYGVHDLAGDVVPLLDALGIERAVLAGHSGSCLVSRRAALDHPERVAGLVLEASPTTLRGDKALEGFAASVVAGLEDPIDREFARAFVVDTSSNDVSPELIDGLTDELLKVPARAWREMFSDLVQYDDTAELGRIDTPTLLVWGDSDPLVPYGMQDQLVNRIRGAELLVYPGVGHTPRWEEPARFAADVTSFVTRAFARPRREQLS
jgi:pimeloyl-ACP methyl ester carboxylesterase